MDMGELIGLVAVVMIFSIPLSAIWGNILKERYRAQQSSLSDTERNSIQRLTSIAERMSDRIETLESILDAEVPDWRDDHDKNVR